MIYVWNGRDGVQPELYDFAHFTLKALSRLMDDFS